MIMGLKNIPIDTVFLQNDDEMTPVRMIGQKMLPILETAESKFIGESLDIVTYIDEKHGIPVMILPDEPNIESWMEHADISIYKLSIPRWAYSSYSEFERGSARWYFIEKKEAIFGSFSSLLKNTPELLKEINTRLIELEPLLENNISHKDQWSMTDIKLYPLLRSLSIVKGVVWPDGVDVWRKRMALDCKVSLEDNVAF